MWNFRSEDSYFAFLGTDAGVDMFEIRGCNRHLGPNPALLQDTSEWIDSLTRAAWRTRSIVELESRVRDCEKK